MALAASTAASLALVSGARAADTVVGFDDLPASTIVSNQYASQGVTFDENAVGPTGLQPVIVVPSQPTHSPPNALDINQCGDAFQVATLWGRFAAPRNHVNLYIGHERVSSAQGVHLQGYDLGGNPIPAASTTVYFSNGGVNTPASIVDPSSQISFFKLESVTATSCDVAIDDLSYDALPSTIPADFGLGAPGLGVTVAAGSSATVKLDLRRTASSTGPISLSASGLPSGVTASVAPNPTSDPDGSTLTLTLTAAAGAPPASNVKVTVTGTPSPEAGSQPRSVTIPVSVSGNFDLRAQGLEVTQGIRPLAERLVPSGGESGGQYTGPDLIAQKPTVVRFYADAHGATSGIAEAGALLYGYRDGKPLPGSPLSPDYGPNTLVDAGNPDPGAVLAPELTSEANAFTFTLPAYWTGGTIQLVGQVLPPPPSIGGSVPLECTAPSCAANNSFTLNGVTFNTTPVVRLTTIELTQNGQSPVPSAVAFTRAKMVTPLCDSCFEVLPYQARVDITDIVNGSGASKTNEAVARVEKWSADNGYKVTEGIASGGIGGATLGQIAAVSYSPTPPGGAGDRPLSAVAHEMFHIFGLAHASRECGGGQDNDADDTGQPGTPWPLRPGTNEDVLEASKPGETDTDLYTPPGPSTFPVEEGFGQLLGVGLDMSTTPYKILADGPNGEPEYYDFMSYCHVFRGDPYAWVSPINWEAVFHHFKAIASRSSVASGSSASIASRAEIARGAPLGWVASVRPDRLRVMGMSTAGGVQITGVEPAIGPQVPAGNSAYALTALGAHGQVLSTTAMTATEGHTDEAGRIVSLIAEVPARGVQSIQIASGGAVLAGRARDAHPPRLTLLTPRPGARVGGRRQVVVSWRASDRDHLALTASVDYSRDGGRTWRTVFVGGAAGRAVLPGFDLAPSGSARVRVRVNDGFNEVSSLSGRFTALPAPPLVTIAPTLGTLAGDATLELAGSGYDQMLNPLRGTHLRWFDGRIPLGSGASLDAGPLPPGPNKIRLLARDSAGGTASASVTVTVAPVSLPFLKLTIPHSVSRGARRLTLSASSAVAANLTVNGHRFQLGPRAAKLKLPLARGAAPLLLHLSVSASGLTTRFAAVVTR